MLAKDNANIHFILPNIDVVKNKDRARRNNNTHRRIIFQGEFLVWKKKK